MPTLPSTLAKLHCFASDWLYKALSCPHVASNENMLCSVAYDMADPSLVKILLVAALKATT